MSETLIAERIQRNPRTQNQIGGAGHWCNNDDDLLVGGGCMLDAPLDANVALSVVDIYWLESVQREYLGCSYQNNTATPYQFTATPVCVTRATAPIPPTDCPCGDVEFLETRIVRVEQAGTLRPQAVTTVSSECDAGAFLLGGTCALEYSMQGLRHVTLASATYAANGAWECHWNNTGEWTLTGVASAICLQPLAPGSAPESDPTADRIVHVEQTVELSSNDLHLAEVTCAAGDFLLWGNCALVSPGDASQVRTLRSGFLDPAQNRPNTWQCGWNNPTDLVHTAKATAVCLKAPSL